MRFLHLPILVSSLTIPAPRFLCCSWYVCLVFVFTELSFPQAFSLLLPCLFVSLLFFPLRRQVTPAGRYALVESISRPPFATYLRVLTTLSVGDSRPISLSLLKVLLKDKFGLNSSAVRDLSTVGVCPSHFPLLSGYGLESFYVGPCGSHGACFPFDSVPSKTLF